MGTDKQYHKKCIQGVLQSTIHQGSVTIKRTATDRHNQKYCQGPPQSKVLPGSAAIKYPKGVQQTEVQQGSATIKMTTRDRNTQIK